MALFRVKGQFEVHGRGAVIAGDIVEGSIKIGMVLVVPHEAEDILISIRGVEFVDHIREKRADVGLIVTEPEAPGWRSHVVDGATYEVKDAP